MECLLILGYRLISIGLRRTENASHVVQGAGSRAETHHGHLVKSSLQCHRQIGLWQTYLIILVLCPYANSLPHFVGYPPGRDVLPVFPHRAQYSFHNLLKQLCSPVFIGPYIV